MSRFWYTATGDDDTSERSGALGFIEASNLPDALLRLRTSGVTISSAGAELPPTDRHSYAVSSYALTTVYPQLADLLDDGTPLPLALRQIASESRDASVCRSLHALADAVDRGATLSEAMAAQAYVYDQATVQAVAAAEAGGGIAEGLRRLNDHQEEMGRLAEQVAFPLIYPIAITTIVSGLMLFLVTFVLPKFIALFKELGMTEDHFPTSTLLLMHVSRFVPWALFIVGVPLVCLWIARSIYGSTRVGRFNIQRWRLQIPLLGQLGLYTALGRVASVLGLLLEQGVDTAKALRVAGQAAGSDAVRLALREAAEVVNEGGSLADGLRASRLLPEPFVFSLGAAELGGSVPDTLSRLVETYRERARRTARKWVIIAGPVIVLCLGCMLLFIGSAMFAPLIGIIGELSK